MSVNERGDPPEAAPRVGNALASRAVLEMSEGVWVARAVQTAAELGIADLLVPGPQHFENLAITTGTHAPSLCRLLRALDSVDVFKEVEPGRFGQTEHSAVLASSHPASVRDLVRMQGTVWRWQSWASFPHSVRTGRSAFEQAHGRGLWSYFADVDPDGGALFDAAMTDVSQWHNGPILAAYDFSLFRTIVDVGGGHGGLLATILAAHPALRGILVDRPTVVANLDERLSSTALADRIQVVAGDFREAVPSGADAYLLKTVLHNWDDDHVSVILRAIRRAMAPHARMLAVEYVLPSPPQRLPRLVAGLDLEMLQTFQGRERTVDDHRALFAAEGLELTTVVPTVAPVSIVEGRPV